MNSNPKSQSPTLIPRDSLFSSLTPQSRSPALQSEPTSRAITGGLLDGFRQLSPAVDPGISHAQGTSSQGLTLEEIIKMLGLATGQTDSRVSTVPQNIPRFNELAALDTYNQTSAIETYAPPMRMRSPSLFKDVLIKKEPKQLSGSEYFPSDHGASSRSSSPEERRRTPKKRSLDMQMSPKSKKKWLVGTGSTSSSRNGRHKIKERKANREMKGEYVKQGRGWGKDRKSSENEGSLSDTDMTGTGSLQAVDDVQLKWLGRDMDILRRTILAGIEMSMDKIITSYLESRTSIQAEEMLDGSSINIKALNGSGSRIRARATGDGYRITKESDYRPLVRDHIKKLLSLNYVPWKNLGIWLYSHQKRFIDWDRIIPANFTIGSPFYAALKKEQQRRMLSIKLEDWTEDEQDKLWNSEIPLVLDPEGRVLLKVVDLYGMYPGQFNKVLAEKKHARLSNITLVKDYVASPSSQKKGKKPRTSPSDSGFD